MNAWVYRCLPVRHHDYLSCSISGQLRSDTSQTSVSIVAVARLSCSGLNIIFSALDHHVSAICSLWGLASNMVSITRRENNHCRAPRQKNCSHRCFSAFGRKTAVHD
ncbi:hypothetical protein WG66_011514 [Moniliophthora roreri]|nr:hypothetical protein WG66_011514 [Moniliophthora roreri]